MDLHTAPDALSPVVTRFALLANERGFTVVRAELKTGQASSVVLDQEEMTLESFIEVAAALGQQLFYSDITRFDPAQNPELDEDEPHSADLDPATRAALDDLRQTAARFADWPVEMQVAFVHQGVVHRWIAKAAWVDLLQAEVDALFAVDDLPGVELTEAQKRAAIERLTEELLMLESFRAATTERARQRIAQEHFRTRSCAEDPFDEVPAWIGRSAISNASEGVLVEQERRYANAEEDLPALVRLLATDPDYCQAKRIEVRKHRMRSCLTAHFEGYPPPPWLIELLLDALDPKQTATGAAVLPLTGEPLFGVPDA